MPTRPKTPKPKPEQHDAVAAATRMLAALHTAAAPPKAHKLDVMWHEARRIWLAARKPEDTAA